MRIFWKGFIKGLLLFPALKLIGKKPKLEAEDVEWVVNSNGELGVKIGDQFFFLYKGDSLVYKGEKPMMWRPVFKREFGECAHPINHQDYSRIGTVSLLDSDQWKLMPQEN